MSVLTRKKKGAEKGLSGKKASGSQVTVQSEVFVPKRAKEQLKTSSHSCSRICAK